jgi:hypothetical protein
VVLDGFAPVARGAVLTAPAPLSWPAKDPADVLDYEFDISAALIGNEGDPITALSATITPASPSDLQLASMLADVSRAVFWFLGGQAGTTYVVQVSLTTASGRSLGRAVLLPVLALATATAPSSALTTDLGAVVTDSLGNPILVGG